MSTLETTKTSSNVLTVRTMTSTAMLSAVAFVLMYIETPIPIMPGFIKFDLSDLPAVIGAFALGPIYGVIIELIKNLLHLAVSQSMLIGELSNFVLGGVFTFSAGALYARNKTKKNAIIAGVLGAFIMGVFSVVSNYFVVYPIYVQAFFGGSEEVCVGMYSAISDGVLHLGEMKSLMQCLVCFNLPFTVIKGLISVLITMFVYQPLRPLLKGNN